MVKEKRRTVIIIIMIIVMLVVSIPLQRALTRLRIEEKLEMGDPLEGLPPGEFVATVLIGGFRAIAINFMWLRAEELEKDKKFHESLAIAKSIEQLQPHSERVWQFISWKMAYNLCAQADNLEDKWMWIKEGIKQLIKGIKKNRFSWRLRKDLAFLFTFKFDEVKFGNEARYYRKRFKEEYKKEPFEEAVKYSKEAVDIPNSHSVAKLVLSIALRICAEDKERLEKYERARELWSDCKKLEEERLKREKKPKNIPSIRREIKFYDRISRIVKFAIKSDKLFRDGNYVDSQKYYERYLKYLTKESYYGPKNIFIIVGSKRRSIKLLFLIFKTIEKLRDGSDETKRLIDSAFSIIDKDFKDVLDKDLRNFGYRSKGPKDVQRLRYVIERLVELKVDVSDRKRFIRSVFLINQTGAFEEKVDGSDTIALECCNRCIKLYGENENLIKGQGFLNIDYIISLKKGLSLKIKAKRLEEKGDKVEGAERTDCYQKALKFWKEYLKQLEEMRKYPDDSTVKDKMPEIYGKMDELRKKLSNR